MRLPRRLVFIAGIALLLAGAGVGFTLWARPGAQAEHQHAEPPYTCPMHPDVRQDGPGRCPICGMALEQTPPAEQKKAHQEAHGTHAAAASPPRPAVEPPPPAEGDARAPLTIDGRRQQLIGVRLVPVTEAALTRALRATGIVRFDESRWTDVNVRTEGWIRTLHVERTGERVARGQPLLSIYSPELATAQAEYVLALRTRDGTAEAGIAAPGSARSQAERLVAGARQRLARWDLPEDHLATLTERREVPPVVIFRSPVSGIVVEKRAVEGMRVMPGESLYRIVDASVVWVEADVYESDLSVVRLGQRAELTFEAWTGETVSGRVSWVAPTLDEATRTARVRIELRNPGGRLKPGMFAHASLTSTLPARAVVPIDALLDSGGRQFVFVSDGEGYFEPRQVKAGARVNGQVQVLEGVTPGEQVAASATFFIDSESQLRAALEGYRETPAAGAAGAAAAPAGTIDVALSSTPDPPRAGMTQFAATVKDRAGRPVGDADVTLVLYMPPMPSMNMPAMRSEAALGHAGNGVYRGSVDVMMNGRWEATVTVTRGTTRLGSKSFTLIAR